MSKLAVMKVRFESADGEGSRLRLLAERLVSRVLRRLHALVRQVKVRVEGTPGAGSGVDKRCRIEVEMPDGSTRGVVAAARTWAGALHAAGAGLRREVMRHLRERSAFESSSPSPIAARTQPKRLRLSLR